MSGFSFFEDNSGSQRHHTSEDRAQPGAGLWCPVIDLKGSTADVPGSETGLRSVCEVLWSV